MKYRGGLKLNLPPPSPSARALASATVVISQRPSRSYLYTPKTIFVLFSLTSYFLPIFYCTHSKGLVYCVILSGYLNIFVVSNRIHVFQRNQLTNIDNNKQYKQSKDRRVVFAIRHRVRVGGKVVGIAGNDDDDDKDDDDAHTIYRSRSDVRTVRKSRRARHNDRGHPTVKGGGGGGGSAPDFALKNKKNHAFFSTKSRFLCIPHNEHVDVNDANGKLLAPFWIRVAKRRCTTRN